MNGPRNFLELEKDMWREIDYSKLAMPLLPEHLYDFPPPEDQDNDKKEYLHTIKMLETSLLSVTSKLDKTSMELELARHELAELKALKEEATTRADELAGKNKELERRLKELHDDAIMRSMMEQMEE